MNIRITVFYHTSSARTLRRAATTVYLRSDLKSFARHAAQKEGLTLSRYIESIIVDELANEFVASMKVARTLPDSDHASNPKTA